jgi:UDP-GlcNAc:undecaprenyl-phosphate/decaprenyl-phosphate GlcNAc-1-phosphate transferase
MSYLLTFILSFLLSVTIIPLVIRIARKRGWFDSVGARKLHKGEIPRLGGIGIAIACLVAIVAVYAVYNPSGKLPSPGLRFWLLMAVGFGYHILGLVDDFFDLRGRPKMAVQFALAIVVVALGYGFTVIELPFAPYRLDLGVLGIPITILWIVGMCNAVNLIDGLDGLAGGLSFIGMAFWAVIFYKEAQYLPAIAATAAGGAILGFLFFNFPPANIFMGDSGSLFLGFLLSIIPLLAGIQNPAETGLLPAITICFVPILDTISAVLRRWRGRVSFFTADRFHLHHKLLNLGFSIRQALVIVYSMALLLGAAALSASLLGETVGFILMASAWMIVAAFFLVLHYMKERGVRLIKRDDEKESMKEDA